MSADKSSIWDSVAEPAAKAPRAVAPAPTPALPPFQLDDEMYLAPVPEESGFLSKLWGKCKREPFIPIGFVATAGILTAGLLSMGKGDKARQQKLMRARVGAQAFTVAAFVVGLVGYSRTDKQTKEVKAQAHQ